MTSKLNIEVRFKELDETKLQTTVEAILNVLRELEEVESVSGRTTQPA